MQKCILGLFCVTVTKVLHRSVTKKISRKLLIIILLYYYFLICNSCNSKYIKLSFHL